MRIGIVEFDFHLHRGLSPVCFWRDFSNEARVLQVGKSFGDNLRSLAHLQTRKIRLTDIQLDLQVIKVGESNYCRPSARFTEGGRTYHFSALYNSLQDGTRNRRLDFRGGELRIGVVECSFHLLHLRLSSPNLFKAWSYVSHGAGLTRRFQQSTRSITLSKGAIQFGFRRHTGTIKLLTPVVVCLGVSDGCFCLQHASSVLQLFLWSRSGSQLIKPRLCSGQIRSGLVRLGAKLGILEADQHLALLYDVALFYSDPFHASHNLCADCNLVVRNHVSRRR